MIKKDKVFELKIDDNDDISGIDSISLVDEPAIEVNWVAFNKEVQEDFHIPDNEDEKYLEKLMSIGQSEEELLAEGWEVEEIDYKENFVQTQPNEPSFEDTPERLIRYKYILNPKISEAPIISTTRKFCSDLLNKNYVWRVEDMEQTLNEFGQSALVWRGGFNCRHKWAQIKYKRGTRIVNKASIKTGVVDDKLNTDVIGYDQPDTITNKTRNNPKPETRKNLGFSMEIEPFRVHNKAIFLHGGDDNSEQGLENGHDDTNLTERGRNYSVQLGKMAADNKIGTIVSSNLKRAIDTAKIAGDTANTIKPGSVKLKKTPLLNTLDIGKYAGTKVGNLDESYYVNNPEKKIPGGETFNNFKDRMLKCYNYIKELPENTHIIAHSKVIRSMKCLSDNGGKWDNNHFIESKHSFDFPIAGTEGVSKNKPKVSLDYNGVLSEADGQDLYKELIAKGNDVYVVSTLNPLEGAQINSTAKLLRIPQDHIIYTSGKPKGPILDELGITKHYDNDPDIVDEIKKDYPKIDAIKFDYDVSTIAPYVDQVPSKKKKVIPKSILAAEDYLNEFESVNFASHNDYPQEVKDVAKRVLDWVDKNGWGDCGTGVGKQRANQLANGEPLSESTIHRMYSYLSRHKGDLKSSKSYDDGCGKLMYDAWGGEPALHWAERKIQILNRKNMSKQYFQTDEEKQIVLGPAMIPNQKIFRKDDNGNPYYVFFSPETIQMIADKYMRNKYIDNNDENHDGEALPDVYVLESWIKQSNNDKSTDYGFENLPVGTWFVSMKVNNPEVWSKVKDHQLNGFSVSGYFEEVSQFSREDIFLYKVTQILKNIKD